MGVVTQTSVGGPQAPHEIIVIKIHTPWLVVSWLLVCYCCTVNCFACEVLYYLLHYLGSSVSKHGPGQHAARKSVSIIVSDAARSAQTRASSYVCQTGIVQFCTTLPALPPRRVACNSTGKHTTRLSTSTPVLTVVNSHCQTCFSMFVVAPEGPSRALRRRGRMRRQVHRTVFAVVHCVQ
jgi:hypothetical protein